MEQTPDGIKRGRRIVTGCDTELHRPEKIFTINSLVWGNISMLLSDSVFYTDQSYLLHLHTALSGRSWVQEQAYISYNFADYSFTSIDQELYNRLLGIVEYLLTADFSANGMALKEYQHNVSALQSVATQIPLPEEFGDSTIYHSVLREVVAFVTNVDPVRSHKQEHLALAPGHYTVIAEGVNTPDISSGVSWAHRALLALAAKDWLLVTWVIRADLLLFSLR